MSDSILLWNRVKPEANGTGLFSLHLRSAGRALSNTLGLLMIVGMTACVTSRDQSALQNASMLKADTLTLMDKATDSFVAHRQDVSDLNARLAQAFDRERSRPDNTKTVQMWDTLLNDNPQLPGSGIYPRFIRQWETKGSLKPAYIANKKDNVAAAFHKIISLESAKPVR